MASRHWPLFDLRVRTPRLELRYPDDDDVVALADVALAGIHDPATMPFSMPWTDAPPDELGPNTLRFFWRQRTELSADRWHLPMAVIVGGEPVGVQALAAESFPKLRGFETGSWLGRAHQGCGLGTEMRRAALHLGFAGLGAERATSGAWHDNVASLRITAKLGYEPEGERIALRRDEPDRLLGFRLTRTAWERTRRDDITVEGLDECRRLLEA